MLIDYVNNYAITILYKTVLILWNLLSFSGTFSLKKDHKEKHHVHVSKRASLSAEWKFFSQCKLGTNTLGSLLFGFFVYWSNNQGSLNDVLLLIFVFGLYLEPVESA